MPKVVITGANGFLGSYLCDYFAQRNWSITALVHQLPVAEGIQNNGKVTYKLYDLSSPPVAEILSGADCTIHCAYAKGSANSAAFSVNVGGTDAFLKAARAAGIKKNIFVSSLASREDALSEYGKQKYACEKLYNGQADVIFRPGLIIGNGGLYTQMRSYLQKSRFIPLISGGNQSMQTISVEDVAKAIELSILNDYKGSYKLASPEKIIYKDFYRILCENLKVKPVFISIPHVILYSLLTISETLGIKLPISRENMLGLRKMTYIDTAPDLSRLGMTVKSFAEQMKGEK